MCVALFVSGVCVCECVCCVFVMCVYVCVFLCFFCSFLGVCGVCVRFVCV